MIASPDAPSTKVRTWPAQIVGAGINGCLDGAGIQRNAIACSVIIPGQNRIHRQ
jgi:hypothetical protein